MLVVKLHAIISAIYFFCFSQAELSIGPRQNCCLRLGVHPGPATMKHGDNVDDALKQQCQRQRQRDLFENPHCVVREHLEFLVESQKSILPMCLVSGWP